MKELPRKSGIDIVGDIPWGSRLCLFYRTPEELLDVLVPYFRTGLANGEACLWITAQPLDRLSAIKALRESIPDYENYAARGQIEIISHTAWFLKDGSLDLPAATRNWDTRLSQATAKGFLGLRAAFVLSWLEKKDWQCFMKFAADEDSNSKNLTICAYSLENLNAPEIIDVTDNYQLALFQRNGKWDFQHKHQRTDVQLTLRKRIKELRCLYDIAHITGMPNITLKERLAEIVKVLPLAFEYPENVFSRICLPGEEFKTANYRDTAYKMRADIILRGGKAGLVEIGYAKTPPSPEKNLFSKEETLLLDAVAERLGHIIEHRQASDALQESEEKFSGIFRASPAIIVITRLEDGRLLEVNDSFTFTTGYTREEALKLTTIDVGIWHDAKERRHIMQVLKTEGKLRNLEVTIPTKTGEIRTGLFGGPHQFRRHTVPSLLHHGHHRAKTVAGTAAVDLS